MATPQNAIKRSGPRLTIDSLVTEPRLEVRSDEYVVHLPAAMVRKCWARSASDHQARRDREQRYSWLLLESRPTSADQGESGTRT